MPDGIFALNLGPKTQQDLVTLELWTSLIEINIFPVQNI